MEYHTLGHSPIQISRISFGCMSLGKDQSVNSQLIKQAFDQGINYFDTADLYDKGWNEKTVGIAIKDFRKEIVLATKVGNQWKPDGSGWVWNPTKSYILKTVDASLQRLQTDYIDLYQLHGGTIDDPIDETIEAFERLIEQGKIRYYGISSIRPNTIREYVSRSNIVSVMMQYSLLDRRPEESCLDLLQQHQISVLTRGTIAKGLLLDKPATAYLGYSREEVERLQLVLQATENPTAAALQYVFRHPAVASAVVGMRNLQQLEDLLTGFQQQVTVPVLRELAEILLPLRYEVHR
ncbi:MAG: aldo/keto reductase [Saprospiraceae bacterium]|nr:aldo/keto reductase [Lewinella sp.]